MKERFLSRSRVKKGITFSSSSYSTKIKPNELYTAYMNEDLDEVLTKEVLQIIYSYCDTDSLLNAYNINLSWRAPFLTEHSSNLFKSIFLKEHESTININQAWSSFCQTQPDLDFWRFRLFVSRSCLRRAREALYHYINMDLMNDFESMNSKNHSREYMFREEMLHWSDLSEDSKVDIHKSLLNEALHFGDSACQSPVQEFWDLDRNCVSYSGSIMGFYIEIKVPMGSQVTIVIDEVNQDKNMSEGNDLSLSFVDDTKYHKHL
ncbi:outer capsid protein VP4 [Acrasis kona]|uniref:Outer capsid protein VP4 n=1 Tax=Acrasis kona TaxID=1008807 RepID=A0AAW2YXP8_9EUKA